MKRVLFVLIIALMFGCEKSVPDLTVTGQIKGLKKGTLYLDRLQDSIIIALDSTSVNGESEFILETDLDEPEVLFLRLDATNSETPRIKFFADTGTTIINTTLKRFIFDAKISGSKQQQKLEEFKTTMSRFNDQNLDIIEDKFNARLDSTKMDSISIREDNLLKRKYLYAINFAMNNRESEVAPYIALSEIYDANIKYLDTLYNALPEHISNSKYGIQLASFIAERKATEGQ